MSHKGYEFVTIMDFKGFTKLKDVNEVMNVTPGMSLQQALLKALDYEGKSYTKLRLCCHGARRGLKVGEKMYDNSTVENDWGVVKNKFNGIVIVGCEAASGYGVEYCTSIARVTKAVVFASEDYQYLKKDEENQTLQLRQWTGKVWAFNSNGSKFRVRTSVTSGYI
jgi:hypothetical protein